MIMRPAFEENVRFSQFDTEVVSLQANLNITAFNFLQRQRFSKMWNSRDKSDTHSHAGNILFKSMQLLSDVIFVTV